MASPNRDEENQSRNNNFNWDLSTDATQNIDTHFSQGDGGDGYIYGTETNYDPFLLEDGFETQFVNLAGETQVVDYVDETQLLEDLDKLESSPPDCNDQVEFSHVSDSEETNITDVLCETQKVSEHDDDDADSFSQKKQSANVFEFEASMNTYKKQEGSTQRGFPSIRAAAFRATGLEARTRASNETIPSTRNEKSSVDEGQFENDKEIENAKNTVSSTAARRLFTEEDEANMDVPDDNIENTQLIGSQNCLGGLSYVNSDLPGELSQANAIEAVEKFLEQNLLGFVDQGTARKLHVAENTKLVSGSKGTRELAKSSNLQKIVGVSGIYDWDDNREDEGGGEFFMKKKELLVDKVVGRVKPLTELKKKKRSDLRNIKSVGKYDEGEQKTCSKKKLVDSVPPVTRNLSKDLDGVMTLASENKLAENEASKNIQAMDDIGPDTQIAAEAIEDLCFELHLADDNANCQGTKTSTSVNNASCVEQSLTRKRGRDTSVGVVTRRAKKAMSVNASKRSSLSSIEQSIPVTNGHDRELGQMSVKEKRSFLHHQLGFTVPVAHRTRKKCTESNRLKDVETSVDAKKKTNDLIDDPLPSNKRRRVSRDKKVQMITIEKLKKLRSTKKSEGSSSNLDELKFISSKGSERIEANDGIEASRRKRGGMSFSTCTPPATCYSTPIKDASPVIMGDEYQKQSSGTYRRSFSLVREVNSLITGSPVSPDGMKEARKRRDVTSIRVLFSQHLNVDVIKQQKKILGRLGAAVASSMSDATHFVADEFVRTRNMLEAIAFGKPIVTRLWLETCGQASCVVDEKKYILRDLKKEREFGFNMPASLSQACQRPLLQGHKVLVTPNTKPGKDILASLVKAVHGLAVERLGRSVFTGEKLPDDLLILSCEEDYEVCVPYLEKGGAVYSSELLLNGIVKQKLEYDRHRLFEDHVKRTRSTLWVKKKRSGRLSATKHS